MRKRTLRTGLVWLALFIVWTALVKTVDVQYVGETGKAVGIATVNGWFHRLTGVHMTLYMVTDWLGLVPVFVCCVFGVLGLKQLVQRKRLVQVDKDILLLGIYYVLVMACYLAFEMMPVNFRPILIAGRLEASYPSSTTLLVLSVMPTLAFQTKRRVKNRSAQTVICLAAGLFAAGMVLGRLISGVHWLTDIAGAVLLSRGLFYLYAGSASAA